MQNPNCRACKHPTTEHIETPEDKRNCYAGGMACMHEKCHCGHVLIDNGEEYVKKRSDQSLADRFKTEVYGKRKKK